MSLGITFLRMNKMRKLGRIPQEEHRSIIGDEIPVPLVGLELDREPSRVPGDVA